MSDQRIPPLLRDDERSLLRALKEMTADVPSAPRTPLGKIASRLQKALTPNKPFDAKAWAESVVKVRPHPSGAAGQIVVAGIPFGIANGSPSHAARIRAALIASLPEHLVSK